MSVVIASELIERILALAAVDSDREICGLLLGIQGVIRGILPAANIADDPSASFEIDPTVLFAAHRAARDGGSAIVGCYHSHPSESCLPSVRDAAAAIPGQLWLIVAGGKAALFRAAPGGGFLEQVIRHA